VATAQNELSDESGTPMVIRLTSTGEAGKPWLTLLCVTSGAGYR